MQISLAQRGRRSIRRATRQDCQVVGSHDFELLGERQLDLSPCGMLIAGDAPAAVGEDIIVSFRTPGADDFWLDAEAEVARIVHGLRDGDPGYCIALRFTYFERAARNELLVRLAGHPPPVPRRRRPTISAADSVTQMPILRVASRYPCAPAGVFSA